MLKVEAVIKPDKIGDVQDALMKVGVKEMSVLEIRDLGRHASKEFRYRGAALVIPFAQRLRLEFIVEEEMLRPTVDAIKSLVDSGCGGDGKILVSHVDSLISIRDRSRTSRAS